MSMTSTHRRDFLKAALGTSTLLSMLPSAPQFLCRAANAAESKAGAGDTILIVVQLAGGNDGLNTVVPYADDNYARARRTLRLTAKDVLRIDSHVGFHPTMSDFSRLLGEGTLTVVQGVGYPNPNQNHPTAMHIWQTARPDDLNAQTGWVGRVADVLSGPAPADVPAVWMGQIARPFAVNAQTAIVPAIHTLGDCTLYAPPGADAAQVPRDATSTGLLGHIERSAKAAYVSSRKIEQVMDATATAEYPALPLAGTLRTIAQLIRADVGIRIYYTELGGEQPGGFDNHASQRDNHASLLRQLSRSVSALVDDLRRSGHLNRVLLMTFSEFGRTIAENGRRGTDHGSAAPMFLVGGKLRGGLFGKHPDLAETDHGGVRHHTDFRRVYATILDRWLRVDSRAILGGAFEPLDLLS